MAVAKALKRAILLGLVATLATACGWLPRSGAFNGQQPPVGTASPAPTGADPRGTPTENFLSATPGLRLQGTVHLADGTPLQGVSICRSFASYAGKTVASTDSKGDFVAEFVNIPGDEMVTVWPYLEGYSFTPTQVYWRHYYGLETRTLDFTASLQQRDGQPSAGCP